MSSKIYVGSLPASIGNKELEALFAVVGTVISANVVMDDKTKLSKGYAFVEMSGAEEVQEAITALNGTTHDGQEIVVSEAKPETKKVAKKASSKRWNKKRKDGADKK